MYARVIKDGSNDLLKPFFEAHINSKAAIKTDEFQITNNLRIAAFFTAAEPRILSTFEHYLSACFNKLNMEIKSIILHQIKRADNQTPTLNLSNHPLSSTDETVLDFIKSLVKSFSAKSPTSHPTI